MISVESTFYSKHGACDILISICSKEQCFITVNVSLFNSINEVLFIINHFICSKHDDIKSGTQTVC